MKEYIAQIVIKDNNQLDLDSIKNIIEDNWYDRDLEIEIVEINLIKENKSRHNNEMTEFTEGRKPLDSDMGEYLLNEYFIFI